MITLRLSFTNADGEVYDIITRDDAGTWADSDGETLAENDRELLQLGNLSTFADLLSGAVTWAERQK